MMQAAEAEIGRLRFSIVGRRRRTPSSIPKNGSSTSLDTR
jgi:hypothetical protein